jgi:hypothetical protein
LRVGEGLAEREREEEEEEGKRELSGLKGPNSIISQFCPAAGTASCGDSSSPLSSFNFEFFIL